MRGRPPAPREQKIREGKTRNLPERVRLSGRPEVADVAEPPAHLELNADAAQWWRDVVPVLAEAGVIESIDIYVLAVPAKMWAEMRACDRVIAKEGMFAMGSGTNIVIAPWVKARRDAAVIYERYLNHLALSPVARARLGLAHLAGQSMALELERALAPMEGDADFIDADVIEADVLDGMGIPGLPA